MTNEKQGEILFCESGKPLAISCGNRTISLTGSEVENFKNVEFHHIATEKGYISRKKQGFIEPYSGKFGKGFKAHFPSFKSTRYHDVAYYIFKV